MLELQSRIRTVFIAFMVRDNKLLLQKYLSIIPFGGGGGGGGGGDSDPLQIYKAQQKMVWEHSGSVVECLTRDQRAMGSSLTALCP